MTEAPGRAAEIAFPRIGMTASGLRKEAGKGRLAIERIAGKDFILLAAIEATRAKCLLPTRAFASAQRGSPSAARRELEDLRAALDGK